MKDKIELKQKHWIFNCPKWFYTMFSITYCTQGLVQYDENELSICGDNIKWLDEFRITATSEKEGNKLAFDYLKKKYPQYGKYIQLF